MAALALTYNVAMAAARDAANRQMLRAGREAWNEDDQRLAHETFNRLWRADHEEDHRDGRDNGDVHGARP